MAKDKTPLAIRPFVYHGVDFTDTCDEQYIGMCVNCLKENHFYVHKGTGQYDCKTCKIKGNIVNFLELIHELALDQTEHSDYIRLRKLRKLPVSSYHSAELAWTGERWLIPIRSAESGRIQDIRTVREPDCRCFSTRGCKTGLWNAPELSIPRKRTWPVWICEGEWDGMALRWLFSVLKYKAIVVAVPGANTFKDSWIKLFNDRAVVFAYDCDDAGDDGMEKVGTGKTKDGAKTLGLLSSNTSSLAYIKWPEMMEVGTDVRDIITHDETDPHRAFKTLQGMVSQRPRRSSIHGRGDTVGDVDDRSGGGDPSDNGRPADGTLDGSNSVLTKATKPSKSSRRPTLKLIYETYKRWITITPEFENAIKLSLATVLAAQLNESVPTWLYMIGPPGCGKTLITGALNNNPNTVHRSSLGPKMLISGYQSNPDPSLLAILGNMCLVLKDFTEVLETNITDQNEVFSILRGAYDGTVNKSYGVTTHRKYEHRFSMLAACTSQINAVSKASMGERALKFHMSGRNIDNVDAGDAVWSAILNLGKETKQQEECGEISNAFLDYEIDHKRIYNLVPLWALKRIHGLAQIVAHLRTTVARNTYTGEMLYRPEPEYGTRLGKQLTKLACLMAEVSHSGHELTQKDYVLVEQVAFDTAIGWNLDIVQAFMNADSTGKKGLTTDEIKTLARLPRTNTGRRLEDMYELGIIHRHSIVNPKSHGAKFFYTVNENIVKLWMQAEIGSRSHGMRTLRARRRRTKPSRR